MEKMLTANKFFIKNEKQEVRYSKSNEEILIRNPTAKSLMAEIRSVNQYDHK